jgi:hypothetical protein
MRGGSTAGRAVMQSVGHGFRIKAQAIKEKFEAPPR